MEYSDKLIALAIWLKQHPEWEARFAGYYDYPTITVWLEEDDKAEFGKLCRALGNFDKAGYSGTISAVHRPTNEDGDPIFRVEASLSGACTIVPKVDEDGNVITKRTTKRMLKEEAEAAGLVPVESDYVTVEVTEADHEYHCPESFLNL